MCCDETNNNCIGDLLKRIALLQKQDCDNNIPSGCDKPFLGPIRTFECYNTRPITLYNCCTGLPWSFTKYSLTEERLFVETGFFNTTENEVRLYRIMDVQLTRSLGQKIVGVGTIHVKSADKTLKDFEIKSVKDSRNVKEMLSELVEKNRTEKRVMNREVMDGEDDEDNEDYLS